MKIVYNGQRKNLNHIDSMIRGQYSDYFHLDMNIGDESLVPPIRKGKFKPLNMALIDNAKPRRKDHRR